MVGVPQGAMRVALQIWQVVLASQTLQVFYFGPSQKGTICSSACGCHHNSQCKVTNSTLIPRGNFHCTMAMGNKFVFDEWWASSFFIKIHNFAFSEC